MLVMKKFIVITLVFFASVSMAQNVGIGPIVPTERLHIHGGAAQTTSIGFTSNSLQAATTSSFKIGLFANAAIPQTRYGFLDLPAEPTEGGRQLCKV